MAKTDIKTAKTPKPDYLGHRERLKQRFLAAGGRNMPDYELLELLLTLSIPRRDVKSIAKDLMARFGSFSEVVNASPLALYDVPYVKESTYIVFNIVREAAVRLCWDVLKNQQEPVLSRFDAMIDYCRTAMAHKDVEEFRVIFLDAKLRVVGEDVQQRGTVNQVYVHPREVIKSAMLHKAKSIILVHNHPSGDVTPSRADLDITDKIGVVCDAVGINLLDHIIVGKNIYYSFCDHGLIKK